MSTMGSQVIYMENSLARSMHTAFVYTFMYTLKETPKETFKKMFKTTHVVAAPIYKPCCHSGCFSPPGF